MSDVQVDKWYILMFMWSHAYSSNPPVINSGATVAWSTNYGCPASGWYVTIALAQTTNTTIGFSRDVRQIVYSILD